MRSDVCVCRLRQDPCFPEVDFMSGYRSVVHLHTFRPGGGVFEDQGVKHEGFGAAVVNQMDLGENGSNSM